MNQFYDIIFKTMLKSQEERDWIQYENFCVKTRRQILIISFKKIIGLGVKMGKDLMPTVYTLQLMAQVKPNGTLYLSLADTGSDNYQHLLKIKKVVPRQKYSEQYLRASYLAPLVDIDRQLGEDWTRYSIFPCM